ncbi:hypothetical protein GUITHDRAFT_153343, partial [Guillardia theta CCMP2712]
MSGRKLFAIYVISLVKLGAQSNMPMYIDGSNTHCFVSLSPLRGGDSSQFSSGEVSFDYSQSSQHEDSSSFGVVDQKAFYELAGLKQNPFGKIWHTKAWRRKIKEKKMYKEAKRIQDFDDSGPTECIIPKEDIEYWKQRQHLIPEEVIERFRRAHILHELEKEKEESSDYPDSSEIFEV